MFKGIIFDMDGTMLDNMMVHHRAWQAQMAAYGMDWTIEEVKEKVHGVNKEIIQKYFGADLDNAAQTKIALEKELRYQEIFKGKVELLAGLAQLLDYAKKKGIPMAIGTAAPKINVDFFFEEMPIRDYFKTVVHANSVDKGKPNPEVFLKCATAMGLEAKDCLVFEDSVSGAQTAKNAGCKAIVVTTTHEAEEFSRFDHILQYIPDYKSLDWKALFG